MLFLDSVLSEDLAAQICGSAMLGAGRREDSPEVGRGYGERALILWEPLATTGSSSLSSWLDGGFLTRSPVESEFGAGSH